MPTYDAASDQVNLGQMDIDHIEHCGNSDSIALVALIDLGLHQFSRCPSATRNDCQGPDVQIMRGWINKFEKTFNVFKDEPELYLPNAAPKMKKMPEPPVVNIVQNPDIQHQMYEMSAMRTQLLFGESRERLNGFHSKAAEIEVEPWIQKFKNFIDLMEDHIDPSNAISTYAPDANLQDPSVNPGNPR